jgi:hypothetical protein
VLEAKSFHDVKTCKLRAEPEKLAADPPAVKWVLIPDPGAASSTPPTPYQFGARVRGGPKMRRSRMRGLQLQTAMMLVAAAKLSDDEIAKVLNVRLSALAQAMDEPYFTRRVEEMRLAVPPRSSGSSTRA